VRCMSTDTDKSTDTDTRGGALQVRCMRKGHGALECPVCLQVLSLLALLVQEYRYVSSGTKFTRFTSTQARILTHGVAPALERSCDACWGRAQILSLLALPVQKYKY